VQRDTRPKKLIKEIRVRPSFCLEPDRPDLEQIGMRYARLLTEKFDYRLSPCSHICLYATEYGQDSEFVLRGIVDSTVMFFVDVLFDHKAIDVNYHDYTVNLIARVLAEIASNEGVDPEPIEEATQIMLAEKDDLLILWKSRISVTKKYRIEPYIKIKGIGSYASLLYVKISDLIAKKSAVRLVAELPIEELEEAAQRIKVQNDELKLTPKRNSGELVMARMRGYVFPITVPLSEFDWKSEQIRVT